MSKNKARRDWREDNTEPENIEPTAVEAPAADLEPVAEPAEPGMVEPVAAEVPTVTPEETIAPVTEPVPTVGDWGETPTAELVEPDGTPIIPEVHPILRVTRLFRGRMTKEVPIPEGEYADNNPRLFGLVGYLLQNGFAEWVEK